MLRKLVHVGALATLSLTPLTTFGSAGTGHTQEGHASYYSDSFHGRKTANGERFNQSALTAAHKTLPLGTKVRVTRVKTGDSVVVRINDRGPYARGRVIDLSRQAARDLGIVGAGVGKVRIEVLNRPDRDNDS